MDDQFMLTGLRNPRPDFAAQLRQRLRGLDAVRNRHARWRIAFRTVAYAASLLLAVGVFALPSFRAGAEAFLDMFRVVNFAAISVQQERVNALMGRQRLDLPRMLGEQVRVLHAPGADRTVETPEEAGTLAGIAVRMPAWLPPGLTLQRIEVSGDQSWTVTASAEKLQRALDTFGINDLSVPAGIDGQVSSIYVPPVVRVTYGTQSHRVVFVEARQPDATLPAGIDLPQLAQIGLRVLGVDRTQAHRFAQEVDWRTTLVVPVSAEGSVFRRVDIQGNSGLLVEPVHRASGSALRVESTLLWSAGDSVFALSGSVSSEELFEMAQSVQ